MPEPTHALRRLLALSWRYWRRCLAVLAWCWPQLAAAGGRALLN